MDKFIIQTLLNEANSHGGIVKIMRLGFRTVQLRLTMPMICRHQTTVQAHLGSITILV